MVGVSKSINNLKEKQLPDISSVQLLLYATHDKRFVSYVVYDRDNPEISFCPTSFSTKTGV